MASNSLSLQNSPIEFVFVGPYKGRDRVVLRSSNAKLDVVGLAIMGEEATDRIDFNFNSGSSLLKYFTNSKLREIHIVQGVEVPDLEIDADMRLSNIQFAWVGSCSSLYKKKVRETLRRFSMDIRQSIIDGNIEEIEVAVSPLITLCAKADELAKRTRNNFRLIMIFYIGIIALISGAILFERFLK